MSTFFFTIKLRKAYQKVINLITVASAKFMLLTRSKATREQTRLRKIHRNFYNQLNVLSLIRASERNALSIIDSFQPILRECEKVYEGRKSLIFLKILNHLKYVFNFAKLTSFLPCFKNQKVYNMISFIFILTLVFLFFTGKLQIFVIFYFNV